LSFFLYYKALMRDSSASFLREICFLPQSVLASLCAAAVWMCGRFGSVAQLAAAGVLCAIYFLTAERMGLMRGVPEGWRPACLLRYVLYNAGFARKN